LWVVGVTQIGRDNIVQPFAGGIFYLAECFVALSAFCYYQRHSIAVSVAIFGNLAQVVGQCGDLNSSKHGDLFFDTEDQFIWKGKNLRLPTLRVLLGSLL
jgi:hypothetical protein